MKLLHVLICTGLGIACLAACSSLPARAKPITKLEARSLPAHVITRRTLDQLADILVLTSGKSDVTPVNVLDYLPFETPAYATDTPNLCRRDALFVSFGYEHQPSVDSATYVRARGMDVAQTFAVSSTPADDASCRQIDRKNFFGAASEYEARDAIATFEKAAKLLATENPNLPVACGDDSRGCLDFLKSLRMENFSSVRDCSQVDEDVGCWSFRYDYSTSIEIKASYDPMQKDPIKSIRMEERIVMVHERRD